VRNACGVVDTRAELPAMEEGVFTEMTLPIGVSKDFGAESRFHNFSLLCDVETNMLFAEEGVSTVEWRERGVKGERSMIRLWRSHRSD
tara:strand:- start:1583 stop:1846 length:264 start_codon:yes stop_codon:yes gene_type:complete